MNLQFERTNKKIDALLKVMADHEQRITKLKERNRSFGLIGQIENIFINGKSLDDKI